MNTIIVLTLRIARRRGLTINSAGKGEKVGSPTASHCQPVWRMLNRHASAFGCGWIRPVLDLKIQDSVKLRTSRYLMPTNTVWKPNNLIENPRARYNYATPRCMNSLQSTILHFGQARESEIVTCAARQAASTARSRKVRVGEIERSTLRAMHGLDQIYDTFRS